MKNKEQEMLHSEDGMLPINFVGEYIGAILALNLNNSTDLDFKVEIE